MNTRNRITPVENLESRTFLSVSEPVPGTDLLDSPEFGNAVPATNGPSGSSDPALQQIHQNLEKAEPLSGVVRVDVFSTVSVE